MIGCALSLLGYLGRYFFLFEQIDSFRVQAFVVCCAGLLLAAYTRQTVAGVAFLVIALLHASQLHSLFLPVRPVESNTTIRVMSSNLLASNRNHKALLSQINEVNPDVIVFQEYTNRWHQTLASNLAVFPNRKVQIIDSPFGIAVYSKHPFIDANVSYYSGASFPAIDVTVDLQPEPVRVLAVHPVPPMSAATFASRNQYLEAVGKDVRSANGPVIVAGDFNAVPWSWQLKDLLQQANLQNARDGFGLKPTWPGNFVPLWVPIDHILHSEHLSVVKFDVGESLGSDHKPVWAELAFP